jgi:L-2,4-diaminobutyric acid acetyltransferase
MHSVNSQRSEATCDLGKPSAHLALDVHNLIGRCPPLDENSLYCNLLQCCHFRDTCAAARLDDEVVGFVSGFRIPDRPDCLFVWQVAVAEEARGMGLAKALIFDILRRPESSDLRFIRTTITSRNAPSWAMFHGLARSLGADTSERPLFDADQHFGGEHDTEYELTIGPFSRSS